MERDPEFVRTALTAIEETGRAAVEDLDRVLGLLRQSEANDSGAEARQSRGEHTAAEVPALVDQARRTGATVTCVVPDGEALADLAPETSQVAYALVQESLTNALRYGDGSIDIALVRVADGLDLTVRSGLSNTKRETAAHVPSHENSAGSAGGRGLDGMRERVGALGGRLTAGIAADGWLVAAHLPDRRANGTAAATTAVEGDT